jgi:hypothetical protein
VPTTNWWLWYYDEISQGYGTGIHYGSLDDRLIGDLFPEIGIPSSLEGNIQAFRHREDLIIGSLGHFQGMSNIRRFKGLLNRFKTWAISTACQIIGVYVNDSIKCVSGKRRATLP